LHAKIPALCVTLLKLKGNVIASYRKWRTIVPIAMMLGWRGEFWKISLNAANLQQSTAPD
jgi:hypothetical protein